MTDWLAVPRSSNASAYGISRIPLISIGNDDGPTLAVIAGVHGDEYEGQIALCRLAKSLGTETLKGRVILVPAANPLAAKAGTRLTPDDGANLNRKFLEQSDGSVTAAFARALELNVLAKSAAVIDIHSGGRSLDYLPSTICTAPSRALPDPRNLDLCAAFGLADCVLFRSDDPSSAAAAARRMGIPRISTELGGGGVASPALIEACIAGVKNVMAMMGILAGGPPAPGKMHVHEVDPQASNHYADSAGVFVAGARPGDLVQAGQVLGTVLEPLAPGAPESPVVCRMAGTVLCVRVGARVEPGDCLYQIGRPAASHEAEGRA